jgi:hypothetical protein
MFASPKIDLTPIWDKAPVKRRIKQEKTLPSDKEITKGKAFRVYRYKVMLLTNDIKHNITDIHLRGFKDYHIDHKISIHYGFKNDIPIEHIAHISNLRMIHHKDNSLKSVSCLIDELNEWIIKK